MGCVEGRSFFVREKEWEESFPESRKVGEKGSVIQLDWDGRNETCHGMGKSISCFERLDLFL